jgi:hypothetical protein
VRKSKKVIQSLRVQKAMKAFFLISMYALENNKKISFSFLSTLSLRHRTEISKSQNLFLNCVYLEMRLGFFGELCHCRRTFSKTVHPIPCRDSNSRHGTPQAVTIPLDQLKNYIQDKNIKEVQQEETIQD